jgi:formylglycine-generating enzyme required for sulfatase activity
VPRITSLRLIHRDKSLPPLRKEPCRGLLSLFGALAMVLHLANATVQAESLLRVAAVPENQGQVKPVTPDMPLLPAPPGGISVPLPPAKIEAAPEEQPSSPPADESGILEGKGKYRNMVLVPTGPFEMGSPDGKGRPDEHPRHKVDLKQFYIARRVVSVKQYCDFLNSQGLLGRDGQPRVLLDSADCPLAVRSRSFEPKRGLADRPMVCVSWYGATDYADWSGGRLPTAAEWEKAALMTISQPPKDVLQLSTVEPAASATEEFPGLGGVSGLVGTVWQWCGDWYSRDYYSGSPQESPPGAADGQEKEIRGGSWASPESSWRVQNRHRASPRGFFRTVGFRVVKD